ncbi:uncharacterized protein LOC134686564 [Mytilus trossulus]|uniref:uncharacterized protein LOC134686564 n=1 Tax=Mytilus trossulus TaxID=6551 RepID=UPI003003F955
MALVNSCLQDTKRQTLNHKKSIDYILSQNQDVFPNKNVPIPYLRTEEPMSEQERIVDMKCDDFFQSLLFTVPGANIWNLKQRIAQKDWFMCVRTKRDGINEIKFKKMDQNMKTVSYRSGTPKERVESIMTDCDEVGRFNSPRYSIISTVEILVMQRNTQSGKALMKVNGGLLKQNYRYLTNATKCQLCIDKNKAVNWCNTCGKNICSFCKLFHQKVWDVMNHDILPLREIY